MADMMASSANGHGATPPRASAAIRPVGSPSGIRGPRMIMQERAAREARQREERESKEREREYSEREARMQAEAIRREEERQANAAATAATGAGQAGHASNLGADPTNTHRRNQSSTSRLRTDNNARPSTAARPSGINPGLSTQRMESSSLPAQPVPSAPIPSQGNVSSSEAQSAGGNTGSRTRNSFPHAFERWETLSAHWEGLTSFWIRRLEQNMQDIPDDQVTKQLARQVTDLSSAGANLFHAVVELQRLRASSERKFQRWFFETRAELERNQEVTAMLETALEDERRSRAEAIQEAINIKNEQGSEKLLKTIAEMRKELTISKEEARRAWEELGRREQEERDRTSSLQQGYPTIVGGVQVVPMTQGLSRGASQRDPQVYGRSDVEGSPARSIATRTDYSQAPAVQPVASAASSATYQAPSSAPQRQQSYTSTGTYSDGEYIIDAQGQFVRDAQGFKVPFRSAPSEASDAGAEDFETPATQPGVYQPTGNQPVPPQTQQQQQQQAPPQQVAQQGEGPDYGGQGFSAPGWESMPRHHHPTRLSDVLEEDDERSRTSASQSQVSRN